MNVPNNQNIFNNNINFQNVMNNQIINNNNNNEMNNNINLNNNNMNMNMMNNNNINFMNNNMNMMNNNMDIINRMNNINFENQICIIFKIDKGDISYKDIYIDCSFNESLNDLFNKFWRFFNIDNEKRKKIQFFFEEDNKEILDINNYYNTLLGDIYNKSQPCIYNSQR